MARAVSVVINLRDQKGKASKTKIFVPSNLTIADWTAFGQSAAQVVANLSEAEVTRVSICLPIDITIGNTLKTVAGAASDVGNKALMMFTTALAGFKMRFNVPTWDETQTVAQTDVVDDSDISVAALITAIEAGYATSTPATVTPCNARGSVVDQYDKGREKFRNI